MKQLMKTRCPECQAWYWCGKACEHRTRPDDDQAAIEAEAAALAAEHEAKHKAWREAQKTA